ncbi:MAG TPA: 16S rRNA (cytosine(1402)-N(4))-methyltransferase, partial [Phycisphaerae bacterium]|nr:16S rRNA (cytosine(1402)-N(4))-methyltransferase [Phycisphaerae bacterium]
ARIRRTAELARIVCSAIGVDPHCRKARIHPATRVFLALRMAVNREIPQLESLLEQAPECLLPPGGAGEGGGRIAVISFHSVEDGTVKRDFRRREAAGQYRIVTRKPIVPDADEIRRNPRARSAKLRVAQRAA